MVFTPGSMTTVVYDDDGYANMFTIGMIVALRRFGGDVA
jgi:hypothetical protein